MIPAIAYVGISLLLIQLYRWRQELEGRTYPFIALTVVFTIYAILGSPTPKIDTISIATLALALWLTASLLWAESTQSTIELIHWLSYLVLFTATRLLPLDLVLWLVFLNGSCFAASQLYRQGIKMYKNHVYNFPIFGNSNHNGIYMLMSLFAGIWLDARIDANFANVVITAFNIIIGIAIIRTECKASVLSMCLGLLFLILITGHYSYLLFLVFIIPITFILSGGKNFFSYWSNRIKYSYIGRCFLYMVSWQMMKKNIMFGYGLNYFKKGMPHEVANLCNKEWVREKLKNRPKFIYSHRAHNDHMELIIDVGLIGYFIFVYLFTLMPYNPYALAFLIVFGINALFFFPLREAHTSIPFWAMAGVIAGNVSGAPNLFILKFTGIAIAIAIAIRMFKKYVGLVYFHASQVQTDKAKSSDFLKQAINHDQYCGDYIAPYVDGIFLTNPQEAFFHTMTTVTNYDGTRLLWGFWDNIARLFMNTDKMKMAEWAINESLRINPNYDEGKKIKQWILNAQAEVAKAREIFIQKVKEGAT